MAANAFIFVIFKMLVSVGAASSAIIAAEAAPTWNYEPSGNNCK
jgi:hypothetical protein